ncbi:MAG: ATP-binding protein [Chitinophagaceae bacterium]
MRFFLLIFLLMGLLPLGVLAQPVYSKSDSSTIFSLLDKAVAFIDAGKNDSALLYGERAEKIAKAKNFYLGQAWAIVHIAEVQIEQNQFVKAEQTSIRLSKIAMLANDTLLNCISLLQLGQIKMYKDDPDQAILLIDKSITSGLGRFMNQYLALAFNDLGYSWGLKAEYERQALFTHKALGVYEELKNDAGIAMTLGNLSTVYYQLGQKEKAIEYGKRSLKYREKNNDNAKMSLTCCNLSQYYLGINETEATKYKDLCIKYSLQSGDNARIIHSYITSSLIANAQKKNNEAFEYELKIIELLEKSGSDQRMLARRYIAAAFYTDMLNYDTSVTLDYYNKSINLANSLNDKANLKDAYLYLSNYHSKKKNFGDAYFNYKKYILYKDSLISSDKEEKIAELESQYEASRKDNEIEKLNNDQKIRLLEIDKQKAIIAGNTAIALQKQNEIDLLSQAQELRDIKIKQQEEQLEKQLLLATTNSQRLELTEKENLLKKKQLKNQKLIRNLFIGGFILMLLLGLAYFNRFQLKKKLEQKENLLAIRNNISQDLHDDIGASLSNINILNELARRNINQPVKSEEYLSKASEDIQRISESLSDIVWNINPRYDDLKNLFVRMKRYAADMLDGKNINGQFDFPEQTEKPLLSMTQRRDMYLIFKEAINNLTKYSQAKNAFISIKTGEQNISIVIKDDGVGFDQQNTKTGNGLQNMEQRAKASGGVLSVQSAPGEGTIINLEMKVNK